MWLGRVRVGLLGLGWCVFLATACQTSRPPAGASTSAADGAAAHGSHGAPAAQRTTLLGNLGSYVRPISTTHREAQQFFDEGLTLLYGFNHEEAYRSFQRSASLDPATPMPHWGMSLALGTNYNDTAMPDRLARAHAHLAEAQQRHSRGSAIERGLVDALAARYVATSDDGRQPARERAYAAAMGRLMAEHPEDLDVAVLYAESLMNLRPWRLYTADGTPEADTTTIVSTLERVLASSPTHPGANHYYIHATEASNAPERALPSAKRLERLVPGAGHLVHMPAHVYIRTGDYLASARSNADAARVDEKYVAATGAAGMYPMMYYGHNLQFESAALMYAGHFEGALEAARKTVALVRPLAGEVVMLQPFALQDALVLARFGRWQELLAMAPPPDGRPVQAGLQHALQGMAHAAGGDVAAARESLARVERHLKEVGDELMISTPNRAIDVLTVARLTLEAAIADAGAERLAALAAWNAAVQAEDRLAYNEPPDWLLPAREGLGAATLRAGDLEAAETVFRADLVKNRNNPRSLHGLTRTLEKQGRRAEAEVARQEFARAWRGADVQLPE